MTDPFTLKRGVDARLLGSQAMLGMIVAQQVCAARGIPFAVTSISDGVHMKGSKHYVGDAFDFRLPSRYTGKRETDDQVHVELAAALGDQYDVVLEKDHLHVEWDPKAA